MGSSVAQELTYGQTGGSQTSGCLGQGMDFAGANVGAPSPAPEPPKPVEEGEDEGTPYSDTSLSILGLDKLRHLEILTPPHHQMAVDVKGTHDEVMEE